MGVDLRLLPFDGDHFSQTMLDCERRRELWEPIGKIEKKVGRDVPENFNSFCGKDDGYDGTCYGRTLITPYGGKLKYVTAKDLTKLAKHEAVLDNEKNRAIWAYLACVSPGTKVALYWH